MKNTLNMPTAIVVAGIIIAGAILFTNSSNADSTPNQNGIDFNPITNEDHLLGNKDAELIIVEFSDTECPYCKNFHNTMNQIVKDYDGQVAWVYRHFPIDQLHTKARKESEATECAAELGGNDGFWAYINRLMEVTPSNDRLDLAQLPIIAEEVGLDVDAFQSCLDSGKYAQKIEDSVQAAIKAGAKGTPYSIVVKKNGELIPIDGGALPYENLKNGLDEILAK